MNRDARRVLLTGASGFLGRHVLGALLDACEVVAWAGTRGVPDDLAHRCQRVVTGDVTDAAVVGGALVGVDSVCHLAAHVPVRHDDAAEAEPCVRVNALGTLALARASAAAGVSRFVYASAGTAYAATVTPAREHDPVFPAARATYYLASKMLGELYLEHLRVADGFPTVSLRITSIYGSGMPPHSLVARLVAKARAGEPLVVHHGGAPAADFVHAADVAACVVAALDRGDAGVYNVGSGQLSTLRDVAAVVRDASGGASDLVVADPNGPVPASFPPVAIDKARTAWGYRPRSLAEGVRQLFTADFGA